MLRDHMINFLTTAVVFLLLTNKFSVLAATCALRLLQRFHRHATGAHAHRTKGWPDPQPIFVSAPIGIQLTFAGVGK
jgi:hypothetical protein